MSRAVTLALSGRHHTALRRHLFPGDGREAVALALCGRRTGRDGDSLLVKRVVPIPHEVCSVRTSARVTWPTDAITGLLDEACDERLALVKIHSHPTAFRQFSLTDDDSDRALFPSIYAWIDDRAPHGSAIMLPDGSMFGRVVTERGEFVPFNSVRMVGDGIHFWRTPADEISVTPADDEHARRLIQTFGDATYRALRKLRFGVVGCSGTGSLVIEQLARNCVGELVLVDPKPVEWRNLNRISQATRADAEARTPKVEVLRRAIQAMGLDVKVTPYASDLHVREVLQDLAACDVLFGCVDTVDARDTLNRLATHYLIPYFDVGVKLVADGRGSIETIVGTVHYLQPGGSSLLSRGVYTQRQVDAARLLRKDPDEYERRRKAGYIAGVDVERPAVISVNMVYAALAVNEFLARLHPFRDEHNGEYAIHRLSLSHRIYCPEPDGPPCPIMAPKAGRGDVEPFLGLWELAHPRHGATS